MTQLELQPENLPLEQKAKPAPSPRKTALVRGLTVAAIVVLSGFLVIQGRKLWLEWTMLQEQVSVAQANPFIGYPDIAPQINHARSPENWYHDEGKETLLWSRWEKNVGHSWFRFASGDIDKALLIRPSTEVVSRAIDTPVVETDGGTVWKRIPGQCASGRPQRGWRELRLSRSTSFPRFKSSMTWSTIALSWSRSICWPPWTRHVRFSRRSSMVAE